MILGGGEKRLNFVLDLQDLGREIQPANREQPENK